MNRLAYRAPLFLYLFGFALVGMVGFALAKTTWEYHKSVSGAFEVRFPAQHKVKSIPLRLDDKTVLFRSEIVATTGEGEEEKGSQKVFLVKVDQTMGGILRSKVVSKLLEIDAYKYKKSAQQSGGTLVSDDPFEVEGFKGREIYVAYGDSESKEGIRVKIMYTDTSRIEMVVTGPSSSMYAFKSRDFFESLKVFDGPGKVVGAIGEGWEDHESPLGLFTVKVPPFAENGFSLSPPKFIAGKKKEKGRFVFLDPIMKEKVFFNFYGYKISEKMDFDKAKTMLLSMHVSNYTQKIRPEDMNFETKTADDGSYGTVTTLVRMNPRDKYPYIDTVLLQAVFNDHGVVVLEYLGGNGYVVSPLAKTLFSLVKFHPEKYSEERAEKAMASNNESQHDEEKEEETAEGNSEPLKANIKLDGGEENSQAEGAPDQPGSQDAPTEKQEQGENNTESKAGGGSTQTPAQTPAAPAAPLAPAQGAPSAPAPVNQAVPSQAPGLAPVPVPAAPTTPAAPAPKAGQSAAPSGVPIGSGSGSAPATAPAQQAQ